MKIKIRDYNNWETLDFRKKIKAIYILNSLWLSLYLSCTDFNELFESSYILCTTSSTFELT